MWQKILNGAIGATAVGCAVPGSGAGYSRGSGVSAHCGVWCVGLWRCGSCIMHHGVAYSILNTMRIT